jgi:hypothetical protein
MNKNIIKIPKVIACGRPGPLGGAIIFGNSRGGKPPPGAAMGDVVTSKPEKTRQEKKILIAESWENLPAAIPADQHLKNRKKTI